MRLVGLPCDDNALLLCPLAPRCTDRSAELADSRAPTHAWSETCTWAARHNPSTRRYPYNDFDSPCDTRELNASLAAVHLTKYYNVTPNNATALMAAATHQPISVVRDAGVRARCFARGCVAGLPGVAGSVVGGAAHQHIHAERERKVCRCVCGGEQSFRERACT